MKKQVSKLLTHLVLFQTLFFQVDLPELVLCFGDDGHIAIEQASNYACDHDQKQIIGATKISQTFSPRHDDCTDINLDWHFSNADIVKKTNKNIKNASSGLVFQILQHTSNHLIKNTLHQLSNTNKHTITAIHTTVLLI